uniref:Uncharacterized protein n=1 Tax=Klebsiella pneumoniae TaxID=573 RepID=A0A7S5GGA3_KLEPN|nr:hypothetical protein pKpnB199_00109 [Klebsiella pneumoniae]
MAEIHDGCAIWHRVTDPRKLTERQDIMQGVFSRSVTEVKPELQAVDTEHKHQGERPSAATG